MYRRVIAAAPALLAVWAFVVWTPWRAVVSVASGPAALALPTFLVVVAAVVVAERRSRRRAAVPVVAPFVPVAIPAQRAAADPVSQPVAAH